MIRRKVVGISPLVLLFLALGACQQQSPEYPKPVPLHFDNDPRILRGVWTGETDGVRLLLDLNASEPSAEGYTVTGTFQLGDAKPVVIEGHVNTPVIEATTSNARLSDPTSTPFSATSVTPGWWLTGFRPDLSPPRFGLSLHNKTSAEDTYFEVTAQGKTALNGTQWTLESVRDKPVTDNVALTLEFGEKAHEGFSGFDGCNDFGARYLANETTFEIIYGIESTSIGCEPAVLDRADAYTSALSDAATYRIADGRLTFADAAGAIVLTFRSPETNCAGSLVPSVVVEVYDDQGQPAALGATATLTNSAGRTASSDIGINDGAFLDVYFDNRGGPFTLEVTRPYHQSVTVERLSTPEGVCGIVNPAQVSVVLTLEPDAPPVRQVVVGGPRGYGACIEEQLYAGAVTAPGVSREVTWESSAPAVVNVTPGGFLRAGCGEAGSASITARSVVDPTKYGVLQVTASGVR